MIQTVVPGSRTTATIDTETRNVRDVLPEMQELEASEAPLTQILSRLETVTSNNMMPEWYEDALLPDFDTLAVALAAGDGTMTVSNGSFYIAGMLVKINDNEMVRVTLVTGNVITIERAYGCQAVAAPINSRLYLIAPAGLEGDTYTTALSTQKVNRYNFCQKVETVKQWSQEDINTETFGGQDLPNEQRLAIIEQKKRYEKLLVHGNPYKDDSQASRVWAMGGFLYYIKTNVKDVSAGFTETEFEDFLRVVFRYGGRNKLLFCSPKLITSINTFARGKLQTFTDDDSYGVTITEYKSAGRHIGLIENPLLTNANLNDLSGQAGYGFCVDPQYMHLVYFRGAETKLHENLQNPGVQGRVDAVRGSPSLRLMLDQCHGIITGAR